MELLKSKHESTLDIVNSVLTGTAEMGITHLTTEDDQLDGRHIRINGKDMLNFGSCSYLGLELDERLKHGAIDAIMRYGTQFSSSRAYVSVTPYLEAESLLEKIFNRPVILASTVTLGHSSNIPVLVGDDDAVILDIQVHNSVNNACKDIKARGIKMESIRHNRMDILEARLQELCQKHSKVWYMADGIYSMYGDAAPIKELYALLDKYENFYLYVDDAHGMSWAGPNGAGYVAAQGPLHEKLYLVTGLAKSFGAAGGVLVYPNADIRKRVRNCGGTMIFSGPLQPANLGAIIASAKIHLSEEIVEKQEQMSKRMRFFNSTAKLYNLPLVSSTDSPIFFVGVGKPEVGYNLVRRLMREGFYVNLSVFPSVSYNCTGLRMPITLHHSLEDIDGLLRCIAKNLPLALREENSYMEDIYKAFKMKAASSLNYLNIIRDIRQPAALIAKR